MKKASSRARDPRRSPFTGEDEETVSLLRYVAQAFVELQEKRHSADYDNGRTWTYLEADSAVTTVEIAFLLWQEIRTEPIAQNYLVSLLIKSRE